jgi:OmpA-OmpF porin, OOP family
MLFHRLANALRRRPRALAAALALAAGATVASPAAAEDGFALPRFAPSPAGDRLFGVPSAYAAENGPGGVFPLHAMVLVDYAHNPLVVRGEPGGTTAGGIVAHQAQVHLAASVVLLGRLTLSVDLPASFQSGDAPTASGVSFAAPLSSAFGDARLGLRFTILGRYFDPFQLALGGVLWAPTGRRSAFTSDGSTRGQPQLIAGGRVADRVVWSAMLGPELRGKQTFSTLQEGSAIGWGLGAAVLLGEDRAVQVGPEITGSILIGDYPRRTRNVEALLGARYRFSGDFEAGVGLGAGLAAGAGTPDFRAVTMLAYTPEILDKRPDRDGDGIADEDDACPGVPGEVDRDPRKNGCPIKKRVLLEDRDYDGVPDDDDACPDRAGPASAVPVKNGCPPPMHDADGDGILDDKDACPAEAGPESADPTKSGCPIPKDRDGDGVPDDRDACPEAPGPARADAAASGCPGDRDGDGIRDDKDACPEEKGAADADPDVNGCPRDVRVRGDAIVMLQQVQFESAAAALRKPSDPILDEVAAVILEHPEITQIEVQGHTDNRGTKVQNTLLSQQRAEAVKHALIKRGIGAERLTAKGYGPSMPLAANLTTEGRARNRRVELKILARRPRAE